MDKKKLEARMRILQALKRATAEAKKLNGILDEMHETLIAATTKKAA